MAKKIKKLVSSVTGGLIGGGGEKAQPITIPPAVVPAAPAPTARTDSGADITIGSQISAGDRVSASGTVRRKTDPLGSLGIGGLRI